MYIFIHKSIHGNAYIMNRPEKPVTPISRHLDMPIFRHLDTPTAYIYQCCLMILFLCSQIYLFANYIIIKLVIL